MRRPVLLAVLILGLFAAAAQAGPFATLWGVTPNVDPPGTLYGPMVWRG